MNKILRLLRNSAIVEHFEVLDFRYSKEFKYFKIQANLIDKSVLFIREFQSSSELKYPYHWQKSNGELVARWDNSPHYPKISTHPHHLHLPGNRIIPFERPGFSSIMEYMERQMKTQP